MAAADWPLPTRFRPLLAGFGFRAPNVVRRTPFEDGEDRVRRTADHRPHVYSADFEILHTEYPVLRRWVDEDINGGQLWFNMNCWIDGAYRWVEARIIGTDASLFEAVAETQQKLTLRMSYEVRELPRLDDTAYMIAVVGGQAEFDVWVSELDIAVNTELKAAAT